ncbi:MAG: ABC transporter permease [Muribaculum sp.]|nr:ABC transporter permease [Muribaculum sp.]
MNLIDKLLRKNTSKARLVGFVLSNFIGLLIVAGAVMFYFDSRSVFGDEESVVNSDYLVVNKRVTSASTLGDRQTTKFSEADISRLKSQPWVRDVGEFSSSDFRVYASVNAGGRGMETALFFESVPDGFVDVRDHDWRFNESDGIVPIIIPKDYLALYNFGFAGSAGLPQLSEQLVSGIPLDLYMRSEDGAKSMRMKGRIAGFSNRLNTVLVPDAFMRYANSRLGSESSPGPSRLIIDVSSPGDVSIEKYLEDNSMEVAGDKSKSSAAYILKVVIGIVIAVGCIITILSLLVLMLSISLLMEKNRTTIHRLLMLGTPLGDIAKPYTRMITFGSIAAWILSVAALFLIRLLYINVLDDFEANAPGIIYAIPTGMVLTAIIIIVNIVAVRRKVKAAC